MAPVEMSAGGLDVSLGGIGPCGGEDERWNVGHGGASVRGLV